MKSTVYNGNLVIRSPGPHIPNHVAAFGRMLRRLGLTVGTLQVMDAVTAVHRVGLQHKEDFREALAAVFTIKRSERVVFDLAFEAFWSVSTDNPGLPGLLSPQTAKQSARIQRALDTSKEERTRQSSKAQQVEVNLTYSAAEALRSKDFSAMTESELNAAVLMLRQWSGGLASMKVRRMRTARGGHRFHLPSTLRASLRQGGEAFTFGTQEHKIRPRPVVVLCDISGSMDRYCRMLLHFMHTMTREFQRFEGFVFGTRLNRITRFLRERDVDAALGRVAAEVKDWGGGTRTGEALREFNTRWLRRVLRSSGIVIIISDGIDRGDPVTLGDEMARLHRSCHRLVWLNPLLGYSRYEPLTRGMRAALPHVTDFLPVHNLDSMAQLGTALQGLRQRGMPQHPRTYSVASSVDTI